MWAALAVEEKDDPEKPTRTAYGLEVPRERPKFQQNIPIMVALIAQGVQIDARDSKGCTALIHACQV